MLYLYETAAIQSVLAVCQSSRTERWRAIVCVSPGFRGFRAPKDLDFRRLRDSDPNTTRLPNQPPFTLWGV